MNFKKLERLKELISEYHWYEEYGDGLTVSIGYGSCTEVFRDIFNVDCEDYPECLAGPDGICITNFEEFLQNYTTDKIEDIFPKDKED